MANTEFDPLRSAVPEGITVPFSFAPNGSSAVTQTTIKGLRAITSVTRTGVGVFDVLFKAPFDDFIIFVPGAMLNAFGDTQLHALWTSSTKTLTLRVETGAVAADIAANANNRLGGVVYFKNTQRTY